MITESQRRAICRIWGTKTKSRGTGFLIADDTVLTAAHVVKSSGDPRQKHPLADFELRFGNPGGEAIVIDGATVERFDPDDDWAVLKLPKGTSVPDARPLRGLPLPAENGLRWETYGYSKASPDAGKAYAGLVLSQDPKLFQIRIDSTNDLVAGLSGSPCLVDGNVVGISLMTDDATPADTLWVLSTERIRKSGLCAELSVWPGNAPYADHVRSQLERFTSHLRAVAVALKLAADEDVAAVLTQPRLLTRVAITMMTSIDAALDAIDGLRDPMKVEWPKELPPAVAAELLVLAGRTWIDEGAAKQLAQALEANRLVIMNSDKQEALEWYVHRAGCLLKNVHGKFQIVIPVDIAASTDAELLTACNAAVVAKLGKPNQKTAAEVLSAHPHTRSPIVVWFVGLPPRSAIDHIRQSGGYKDVRFVFLVGYQSPMSVGVEYADAVEVSPRPQKGAVEAAIVALQYGEDELSKIFT